MTLVSPAGTLDEQEFQKKFADWKKSYQQALKDLNSPADQRKRTEAQRRFQELYAKRSEFMQEDRTGFVWLYLQK